MQAPQRRELGLGIQLEAIIVDPAIEMNRQLRDPRERPMQAHRQAAAVVEVDGASEAEIAVEPAIEQHAAIDLDPKLQAAFAVIGGARLEA